MNVKALLLWITMLIPAATACWSQGFAGLGTDATGYSLPDPETRLTFPGDHGAHPGFRIEWWYLTANLRDASGEQYGVQWTLFRSALSPDDDPKPIWMGHSAVTTKDAHFAAERFARGGTGQAGVTAVPFSAWIDEWHMKGMNQGTLSARGPDFGFDLALTAQGPIVPQGQNGYSVKSPTGQASHYFSQPFYAVEGSLSLPNGAVAVTGLAWLDREWSSQPLANDQSGWDWVSLHFDNGEKLMGFRLRSDSGAFSTGTFTTAAGETFPLAPGGFIAAPRNEVSVAGRRIPTSWDISVPDHGIKVRIDALNDHAWMDLAVSYWEGPVEVTGSHSGVGYLELTGYE